MNIFQKIKSGMLISGAVLIVAGLVLLFSLLQPQK